MKVIAKLTDKEILGLDGEYWINYYFLVLAQREGECCLTEAEKGSAAAVQWHPLKKVADLITNQKFERVQGKYLCARDVAALKYYEEMCQL